MIFEKKSVISKDAPKGRGPFSQAVRCGPMVFVSGQGPISLKTNAPIIGTFSDQATLTLENIKAVLAAADLGLQHVVKVTVYLSDLNRVEEFNEIYQKMMPEPWPARTLVAAGLRGIDVEIDVIAIDPSATSLK